MISKKLMKIGQGLRIQGSHVLGYKETMTGKQKSEICAEIMQIFANELIILAIQYSPNPLTSSHQIKQFLDKLFSFIMEDEEYEKFIAYLNNERFKRSMSKITEELEQIPERAPDA